MYPLIVGDAANEVCATHPLYNIPARCVWQAAEYFRQFDENDDENELNNGDDLIDGAAAGKAKQRDGASADSEREKSVASTGTTAESTVSTEEDSLATTTSATATTTTDDEETPASN